MTGSFFFVNIFRNLLIFPLFDVIIIKININYQSSGKEKNGMKIELNPDAEIVKTVKEGLKQTGGYCPCRRERTPETKCMCKEFRDQIADENYEGFCHCMLYYKKK